MMLATISPKIAFCLVDKFLRAEIIKYLSNPLVVYHWVEFPESVSSDFSR
jgi:hypothetical protein